MRKYLLVLIFLIVSCADPYSSGSSHRIELTGANEVFFNSTVYGVGGGHYKVILSKKKNDFKEEKRNLNLGELFDIIYTTENGKLTIYTYKSFNDIPSDLKDLVIIRTIESGVEYNNLLKEAKNKHTDSLNLYQPFEAESSIWKN